MLSARSPKYPALYDELSQVRFISGRAQVSEEQALLLAERRFADGIVIGEFDEDGRPMNELPAKKWAAQQEAPPDESGDESGETGDGSGEAPPPPPDDATAVARKNSRSK